MDTSVPFSFEPRDRFFTVRVSASELQALRDRAGRQGIPVAALVRRALLEAAPPVPRRSPRRARPAKR